MIQKFCSEVARSVTISESSDLGILVIVCRRRPPALSALMVRLEFQAVTRLSALRSFHVTRL